MHGYVGVTDKGKWDFKAESRGSKQGSADLQQRKVDNDRDEWSRIGARSEEIMSSHSKITAGYQAVCPSYSHNASRSELAAPDH